MRVWLVPSRFAPHVGGIETVVSELAHELQRCGDEVLVITHREPVTLPAEETVGSVRVKRVRFEAPSRSVAATRGFLESLPAVTRSLSEEARPDIIHVHGAANQVLPITRHAVSRRIPLVITTHGEITGDTHDIYGRSRYMRASLRYGVRRCAAVTAPSQGTLDDLRRLVRNADSLGHVVPNGVRVSEWESGLPTPETKVVLGWGRLEKQKGFDRLLAAWPLVRDRLPEASLCIAGDGEERLALQSMLTPGASLLGPLSRRQLAARLRGVQIAAVPSRVEAFGMSALEALAAGRPVLHSGLPSLQTLVGSHGWSAPHDDPAHLASAMAEALSQEPRTVPATAVQRFDWAAVLDSYRVLYDKAVR